MILNQLDNSVTEALLKHTTLCVSSIKFYKRQINDSSFKRERQNCVSCKIFNLDAIIMFK